MPGYRQEHVQAPTVSRLAPSFTCLRQGLGTAESPTEQKQITAC